MHVSHFGLICSFIFIGQFGYGFGLAAYLYFMLCFSQGAHERQHYTFCTSLMALGMMLPGIFSGWLQGSMGYYLFYWLATGSGAVTIAVSATLSKYIKQINLKNTPISCISSQTEVPQKPTGPS